MVRSLFAFSGLFRHWLERDKINKIVGKLAEANNLKGVIDAADFNNDDKLGKGKEMVDRLSNLVSIFNNPAPAQSPTPLRAPPSRHPARRSGSQ
jgi:type I restriction-modification system DNA methylase subunit